MINFKYVFKLSGATYKRYCLYGHLHGMGTVQSSQEKIYAGRCLLDSRVPFLIIISILLAFRNWFCTRGVSLENSLFINCISAVRISYSSTENLVTPKKVHAGSKYELDLSIIASSKCLYTHFIHTL